MYDTREEAEALKTMLALKAPGPDGFHAYFFQQYWNLAGKHVCEAVLGVLKGREMPSGLNDTFISVIPKIPNLHLVT